MMRRFFIISLLLMPLMGLNACDSEPPALMKASKQFESDEIRDRHVTYMRKNHMDALKHKRDETMYNGIRTKKNSINACIDCHVPESYNGQVLRHTDQEHFCTTCHTYVAAKLDCFECHVDHPIKLNDEVKSAGSQSTEVNSELKDMANFNSQSIQLDSLNSQELMDLAFKYSDNYDLKKPSSRGVTESTKERSNADPKGEVKPNKSGGVSLKTNKTTVLDPNISNNTSNTDEAVNE